MTKEQDPKGKGKQAQNPPQLTPANLVNQGIVSNLEGFPTQAQLASEADFKLKFAADQESIAPSLAPSFAATAASYNTQVATKDRADEIMNEFKEILETEFGPISKHQFIKDLQSSTPQSSFKQGQERKRSIHSFKIRSYEISIPDTYLFYLTKKFKDFMDESDYALLVNRSGVINEGSFGYEEKAMTPKFCKTYPF